MKQILISFLLLSSLLYSDIKTEMLSKVETLMHNNNIGDGCKEVEIFYKKYPYDYKANLYYGKCAYIAGDTDRALAAYGRADILNENDAVVHQYLGDLHTQIGNIEIANSEYDKADLFGANKVQRVISSNYTSNKFSILARFSGGSDSNVKYNAELSEMNAWFGVSGYTTEPESDLFFKEYIRISHVYDSNPYTSFYYKNQMHVYNKNYLKLNEEDFFLGEVYSGPGWATQNFDFWIPLSYTYMAVSYEEYADVISLKPQLRIAFANRMLLRFKATYESQTYKKWNSGDIDRYSGQVSLSKWFEKNYFRVAYLYMQVDKKESDSPRIFLDRNINELEFNYTRVIGSSYELGLSYLYSDSFYKDEAIIGQNKKRRDNLQKASVYLSYNITNNIGTVIQYDYYNNETNYAPLSYEKEVVTLGLFLYY